MTAHERTGFRDDLALNDRHRLWGDNVPAVDIDWLLVEYDRRVPVALIDYQHAAGSLDAKLGGSNLEAFTRLADMAGLPAFVVRYRQPWEFSPYGLNDIALGVMPDARRLDEESYVRWLYRLRGRRMPESVRDAIRGVS